MDTPEVLSTTLTRGKRQIPSAAVGSRWRSLIGTLYTVKVEISGSPLAKLLVKGEERHHAVSLPRWLSI